jgi:hypothetical protein
MRIVVECKVSSAPDPSKGFWRAIDAVKPNMSFIVIPTEADYQLAENVRVVGLNKLNI